MSAVIGDDLAAMAEARRPSIVHHVVAEKVAVYGGYSKELSTSHRGSSDGEGMTADGDEPTMAEMKTLRRVSGKIPWTAWTITFVEFCERFSYYGTTAVFVNFLQQPRPFGSRTGAVNLSPECYNAPGWSEAACAQPGGLGQGQQTSTGLTVMMPTPTNLAAS